MGQDYITVYEDTDQRWYWTRETNGHPVAFGQDEGFRTSTQAVTEARRLNAAPYLLDMQPLLDDDSAAPGSTGGLT